MKIAIATVQVPFVYGGAEFMARNLKQALEKVGHQAEIITMPFKWYPPERIPEHILASRLLDISETCGEKIDLMIGLKFPAYYFKHSNKVLWILHQHRTAYDLWQTKYCDLNQTSIGYKVRDAIISADNIYINEAKKIFTISNNVKNRLQRFNNISATTLYHPCPEAEKFNCEAYDNFILFPSRINEVKRQYLAIEAMKYINLPTKLYIIGNADNPSYLFKIKKMVNRYDLRDKVIFKDFISEEEKRFFYANCRAVLFPPFDEDYGYITLEAFYSSKPVITCEDSGGPLEFVEDNETGFICKPDPKSIAEAIDKLSDSETLAKTMGNKAREKILSMNITWDNVVKELTSI
ncbi:MAG: glycosyltransferase family 4 protein [Tepidanaerobacteraceae bacterium]|nr:glycosyltransferase family 4 protein [Tepidanaerobacteraceae bacterium]